MKIFTFLILFYYPVFSWSQVVLLRAPGASPVEFQTFMRAHKEVISFIDYMQGLLQQNAQQEAQLFHLSDTFAQNTPHDITQLKAIQSQSPLTLLSLRYIRDLAEKSLAFKTSSRERQELLHFYCKSATLLQEAPLLFHCVKYFAVLAPLQNKYPQLERILIESMPFTLSETAPLAENTPYNWTLLSNSQAPIHFFGTFQQLLSQQFIFENLAEGDCDKFSTHNFDFNLINRGRIFFSTACPPQALASERGDSWIQKNKPWLYGAGAVALGGLLYALKDKTIIFNTSSIK